MHSFISIVWVGPSAQLEKRLQVRLSFGDIFQCQFSVIIQLLKLLVAVQNPLYRDLDISTIETDANLKASLNGDKNQTGSLQYHLMTSISVENDQLVFDADVVAQSCDVAEVMPSSIAINGDEAPSIGTDATIVLENSCITDIEFDGPVIDNARNEFVRAVATKLGKEVAKVEREEEAINEFDTQLSNITSS